MALRIVRQELPDAVLSIDTFRPEVACMAVEEFGADIINDISGGSTAMFRMVSRQRVPYILTSQQATMRGILLDFAERVQQLRDFGQQDIILDTGFGFGKSLEDNYLVMSQLEQLQAMELPVLVGISRKSMIYKLLESSPERALNGTTMLNTVALMKGASILRVHDVHEAVECITLFNRLTVKTLPV
jgi:dihydropteroate synthase